MFSAASSISPRETEISLILSTANFPVNPAEPQFRKCDLTFNLSPSLQFSNCKWLIGVKALTIPTRLKNIDSSFVISILNETKVSTVQLGEAHLLTVLDITNFLNQQISSKTAYGANIIFSVSSDKFSTCQVMSPPGVTTFAVTFSRNLCNLLGYDVDTTIVGSNPAQRPLKAGKLCDPYADFKLIDVKCNMADGFSTGQVSAGENTYPGTTVALIQVSGNYPIDDSAPVLSAKNPAGLYTVSIPMEGVVFYPISSQTLFSVNFKLLSLSRQLLKVDAGLPVVFHIILRKADHNFV